LRSDSVIAALLPVPESLLLYGAIAVVLIAAAAAVLLYWKKHHGKRVFGETARIPVLHNHTTLSYLPKVRPVSPVIRRSIPQTVQKPGELPRPKEVNIRKQADITGSFGALAGKYSLGQFTIATSDGLVFASSGDDAAQTDAAQYGELYAKNPLADTPGVVMFGLSHKGSDLVGIIRTDLRIPEETLRMIELDTKDILNWWI
jgi:hypothetical protein